MAYKQTNKRFMKKLAAEEMKKRGAIMGRNSARLNCNLVNEEMNQPDTLTKHALQFV